jgi:hypothetical protein
MTLEFRNAQHPKPISTLACLTTLALSGQAASQERPLFPPPVAVPVHSSVLPEEPKTSSTSWANSTELQSQQLESIRRMRASWAQIRLEKEHVNNNARLAQAQEAAAALAQHQSRMATEDLRFREQVTSQGALGEARQRLARPTVAERVDVMFSDPDLQPHPTNGLAKIREGLAAAKAKADQAAKDEMSTIVTVASIVATCYGGPVAGAAVQAGGDVLMDGELGLGSAVSLGTAIASSSKSSPTTSSAAKSPSTEKAPILPGKPVTAPKTPEVTKAVNSGKSPAPVQPFGAKDYAIDISKIVIPAEYGPQRAPLDSLIFPDGTSQGQKDTATGLIRSRGLNYDGAGALPSRPDLLNLILGEEASAPTDGITYGNYQGSGGLDSTARMSFEMAADGTLITRYSLQQFKEQQYFNVPFDLDPFSSSGGFEGGFDYKGGTSLFSAGISGPKFRECWGTLDSSGFLREHCGELSTLDFSASLGLSPEGAVSGFSFKGPQARWDSTFMSSTVDKGNIYLRGGKLGASIGPEFSLGTEGGMTMKPGLSWFSVEGGIIETRIDPTQPSEDAMKDIRWRDVPLPQLKLP